MQIYHSTNPLKPSDDCCAYQIPKHSTANDALKYLKLKRPTILLVNGNAWCRSKWNTALPESARIFFVELPADPGSIFFIIFTIMVGVGAYLYAKSLMPDGIGSIGTPNTVYSFNTGSNRLRLGQPFVEHFGRFRAYPDLAQQSYIQNIDNDQYMYFLGIVGVGEYSVEEVYIDNTPLTEYADSSYNIIAPAGSLALVSNLVWTCNEASGQELGVDWISYIASAPLTELLHIEYDVTFAGGLVSYNDEGNPGGISVTVETQVREVDELGSPTSDSAWETLETRTFSASSKDPLRYSRKIAAPQGAARYQVRARRTTAASGSSRVIDKVMLSGLRGYGAPHPDYGDVTLIEAKIKATDQLNGNAASQINVVATRKLYEVTAAGFGSTLTATRSIVDAVAHMVTSDNGGQQDDALLDFETLDVLRDTYETAGHNFDYRFMSKISVMDAAAKAAYCGLSVPCMPGGKFALVLHEEHESPSCLFTDDNLTDLKITAAPRTPDSLTCVEVTYVDPDTWDEEVVTCLDGDGSTDNPLEVTLDGCTTRQQAYEIGMFLYLQEKLERAGVEFTTGLAGYIPSLLSKVLVPNRIINWSSSGLINAVNGTDIWLSDPVDFDGLGEGSLYIVLANGTAAGPYTVTAHADAHCVQGLIAVLNTMQDDDLDATRWIFGTAADEPLFVRVNSIKPQGRDAIRIAGSIIDDDIYADPGTAPALGSVTGTPALLLSFNSEYTEDDSSGHNFHLTWAGSAPSVRIEIDEGSGYAILEDTFTAHTYDFSATADEIDIKITPYNSSGIIQTAEAQEDTVTVLIAPTGLAVTADGDGIEATWNAYDGAIDYFVSFRVDGDEIAHISIEADSAPAAELTWAQIVALGGPWPEFDVYVWVVLADGQQSASANANKQITALVAPAYIYLESYLSNGFSLSWDEVSGAKSYIVCHSDDGDSDGEFTPAESNIVYEGELANASIVGLSMDSDYRHCFKVAAQQYGHDIADLNFSDPLIVEVES